MLQQSTSLEKAVMQTVAYSDVFQYPVTVEEIYRYLIGQQATTEAITAAVDQLVGQRQLAREDAYIFLPAQGHTAAIRQERHQHATALWPLATHYGGMIGSFPFVKMVSITGSLAVDNIDAAGDIDYMIITEPERLWFVRLLTVALVKWVQRKEGITLCPNYLITTNALRIQERNLFTARELVQMIPVSGLETYDLLREQNTWTARYFPNAVGSPQVPTPIMSKPERLKRLGEGVFRTPIGGWVDRWEMHRKIKKLTTQANGEPEADFNADWCKGHFDGHMQRIIDAYHSRLQAIQLEDPMPTNHKVLFGQSYFLRFDSKLWDAMQPYPPLGTLYAAAYIRERGYDVALFDAMLAESEEEWAEHLRQEQPQYAVIYEDNFNYLSKMCLTRMREAAFTMIEMAKQWGCTVIICGSDATDHYGDYLNAGADYVILGEGEETLGELLDALTSKTDTTPNSIMGVVTAMEQPPTRRQVMKNLDDLPLPAWDLVDVDRYRTAWIKHHGYFSMNLATTRGCPYHCNWCAKPIWGQRYNVHSPQRVAAMLQHLHQTYQPDHIWFADDIMGLKPGWMEAFADAVEAAAVRTPFKCLSRADLLLRGDTINALKRAGCDIVWIGAESGSQKILDAMEKGTKVEQIREAAHKLHAADLRVGFFLQFGYPGETRADIAQTLQLVRDAMPDDIGISVSYPLPGTKFHARVRDELGHKHNWTDSNDMAMLYEGPFTTEFYRQLHTVIHKEFRSRRTWQTLRQPAHYTRRILRDTAAMCYHTMTLPLARRKLDRLAQAGGNAFVLRGSMDYMAAATPSPQLDE